MILLKNNNKIKVSFFDKEGLGLELGLGLG
jgi:hypothetical protein